MKKKIRLLFCVVLLFFVVGCSKELGKEELSNYYKDLLDTYADGMIPVYEDKTDDELTDIYKDTLKKLTDLKDKYSDKKGAEKQKDQFESIKKLNGGMIKEFKSAVKGEADKDQSYKDGRLIQEIADKYEKGKRTSKFDKLIKLASFEKTADNVDSSSWEPSYTPDSSTSQDTSYSSYTESSSTQEETADITKLTETPSSAQKDKLQILAQQQFDEQYPYQGSKIHSVLGVIQDWTKDGDNWFYKAEATITNAYNAKRDCNIEVTIVPLSPDTGTVTIIDY